jgi:hypothetical protein
MQFSQNGTVSQLYIAADNGNATPGTLLYLLPQNTASPPSSITFSDAWTSYSGTYIFLEQPLASGTEGAFAASAWAYLSDPRMQGTRFAWFNQPDGSGILTGTTVSLYTPQGGQGFVTSFPVSFVFQNVSLYIAANTAIAPDNTNFAFTFTQSGSQSIYLTSGWGTIAIETLGQTLTLPFTGNLAGCLQFSLQLTQQNQTDLNIGFRYFYAIPPDPEHPGNPASDFFLASLRYPVFNQALALYANLDPLAGLNPARTFFAFNAADAGQQSNGAPAAVASYFNSTMGDSFSLQPLTGSNAPTGFAALVFSRNQQGGSPSAHDPFYIVPKGDFALQTSRSGTVDLMCGLSGVEYLMLAGATNLISFFPGNPAYAQGFFPGEQPGYTDLQPQVMPSTSYSSVTTVSSSMDYFAQPEQSVLYNYNLETVPGVTSVPALAVVPVHSATVNWPPVSSLTFPMLPYSGLAGQNLAAYQQMESQSVSAQRRLALSKAPPEARALKAGVSAQQSKYSTTPQGLLATYVAGSAPTSWDEIILAQMALPVASPEQMVLTNVTGNLLSAFQSNKLFLVATDPASIQSSLLAENAQIIIGTDPSETWQFNLDPAQWTKFGTIFIIKFYNMSLNDLAGQTSTWASGGYFNQDAASVSETIKSIIASVDTTDTDFAAFLNAVNNPNWNGILILNAMAPLQELPSELAGLAAGIDPSLFFAHHVGINASLINVPSNQDEPLSISNSSIFGLINYNAPSPLKISSSDYQFQVEKLKVLFLNSAVAGFSSVIDLQINNLFGELTTLEGSSNNTVKMYGVYQKHVVNGQTLESYLFQTQSGQNSIFDMTSRTLNAVLIAQGQFVTIYPVPLTIASNGAVRASGITTITTTAPHNLATGDSVEINGVTDTSFTGQFSIASVPSPTTFTYAQANEPDANSGNGTARDTETISQFVFWGQLDFKALANFDLFSFGRPTWQIGASSASGAVRSNNVTTITTTAPHGLNTGSPFAVAGVSDSSFNGQFTVASVPSPTSLTYAQTGKPDAKSGNGTVAVTTPAGLSFGNLIIEMTYDSASTQPAAFIFDATQLSFDLADSFSRPDSFFRHFPLTVGGFTQAKSGTTPSGQGFMSLQTPLPQSSLVYPWYSLNFNLNLGSPGALAAQVGFVATMAAAWSPSTEDSSSYKVFTGLQLPGSSGSKQAISIEGLFNITFKTLEIIAIPESNTYILVLYNIGFKFFSFSFPPTGQVNFVLFGDPGSTTTSDTSLGWYAAYAKPATNGSGGTSGTGGTSQSGLLVQPRAALVALEED